MLNLFSKNIKPDKCLRKEVSSLVKSLKPKKLNTLQNEEATKTSLILPFIKAMGYDIFNPNIVNPEFTADVGIKKGEKVDYAIQIKGKTIMLFECKMLGVNLDKQYNQLYRYFNAVTECKIGVLTDGIIYKLYSDSINMNVMDPTPFYEFNIKKLTTKDYHMIDFLCKSNFNAELIKKEIAKLTADRTLSGYIKRGITNVSDKLVNQYVDMVKVGNLDDVCNHIREVIRETHEQMLNETRRRK